jgi:flagellar protein FlgJ
MDKIGLAGQFALDLTHVGKNSSAGGEDALRRAAEQFEAMFLEKMISSAREAYLKSDLGRGPQLDFYESLMDKQWSQHIAGHGLGLAEQLVRQIHATDAYQARTDSADSHATENKGWLE